MTKDESKLIELYPKRWADFLAGVQSCYPLEVPPMVVVRRDFVKHLNEYATKKINIKDTGHIQYLNKD